MVVRIHHCLSFLCSVDLEIHLEPFKWDPEDLFRVWIFCTSVRQKASPTLPFARPSRIQVCLKTACK